MKNTRSLLLLVACIMVLSVVSVTAVSANGSNPEWNTSSPEIPEEDVSKAVYFDIDQNGDATVRININYQRLEPGGSPTKSEYHYYNREDPSNYENLTANVTETMKDLAQSGSQHTDRDMSVELVGQTDDNGSEDETELNYWYTYEWNNLAAADDTRLVVSEPFSQGYTMFEHTDLVSFDGPGAISNANSSVDTYGRSDRMEYSSQSLEGVTVTFTPNQSTTDNPANTTLNESTESESSSGIVDWRYILGIVTVAAAIGVTVIWRRSNS